MVCVLENILVLVLEKCPCFDLGPNVLYYFRSRGSHTGQLDWSVRIIS